MNILDENIPRDQAELLQHWGVRCRSISRDLGHQGIQDDNIIPLLLRLKTPTLLTRDADFFEQHLVHTQYALAWFDVDASETAFFIRRFLGHPLFRWNSQRLGKVVHIHPHGIEYWTKSTGALAHADWVR